MNPVAEALTRWNHSEASGLPIDRIFRLVHAKTRQAVENPALQALRERCVVALADSSLLIARDGSEIPIDDTAAPILADHDCVSGAVLVFRDITSRLQAVEALRKTEEELRQAERVEAIGRLAGGIAHDINNRMTVVIGCCEVLLDELPPGSPHIQLAKDIKDAGDRAAWLVRQLLAFGRRQLLRPSVVSLNDVVAGMKQMIRRSIGNDVAVALRLGSDIGQIRIDPRQIEQVILNLAMNARDAMPMGGTLTIETCSKVLEANMPGTPGAQPGRYTLLTVTDTGIGMDVATKAHIFEPFFTTKPIGEGTGLGLATVYGIVKQSSGSIYVSSEPGQGTAFEIYFPEVEAPAGGSHPAPRDRRCANSIHPQAIPRARPDARRPPGARCHGSVKRGRLRARDVDDNTLRCYSGVSQGTRSYSAIRPGRRCHQPCVASRPAL
jgi:PAS domain S-box-containing protein